MTYIYKRMGDSISKVLLFISIMMVLLFSGCCSQKPEEQLPAREDQGRPPKYISDTLPEDCCLCGEGKGTLLPFYWGQDNVGIISLNTFTLLSVETNRYSDQGKRIEEPAQHSESHMLNSGDGGYTAFISENPDRGYASGSLYFGNDEVLDLEKSAAFLCTQCLNRILDESWDDDPYGVGIVNFNTREIRLLEKNVTAFIFDDFYISCDLRNRGEDKKPEMDLLIFYCPERYK
ncbi:hypothetical protein [Enterocloster bolteae]|uniref:hypothetical protein n=1 Tax=Enterocloster bolteae TaxID=208479 RepID=UPI0028DB5774|nr:hypothetical protein [Enterocloster bolteae]